MAALPWPIRVVILPGGIVALLMAMLYALSRSKDSEELIVEDVQPADPRTVYLFTLSRGDPRVGMYSRN